MCVHGKKMKLANVLVIANALLISMGIVFALLDLHKLAVVSFASATIPLIWFSAIDHPEIRKWVAITCWLGTMLLSITSFGFLYSTLGLIGPDDVTNKIDSSIYFSVVTWTTLGYGDFRPSEAARFWAASEAMLGYIQMGLFVALLIQDRRPRANV